MGLQLAPTGGQDDVEGRESETEHEACEVASSSSSSSSWELLRTFDRDEELLVLDLLEDVVAEDCVDFSEVEGVGSEASEVTASETSSEDISSEICSSEYIDAFSEHSDSGGAVVDDEDFDKGIDRGNGRGIDAESSTEFDRDCTNTGGFTSDETDGVPE